MIWDEDYKTLAKILKVFDEKYVEYLNLAVEIARQGNVLVACEMLKDIEFMLGEKCTSTTKMLLFLLCRKLKKTYGEGR